MVPSRPFPLMNLLRGRLAERILTVLLERGGYRVTRLGIEELFDEVKYLDREQYLSLDLPEQLRTLPDLLVTDPGVTWAKLIEVKYRRVFKKDTAAELFDTLTEQRRFWPQSSTVIILGQPFSSEDRFHQDYIRVIPADGIDLLKGPRGFDIPTDERGAMDLLWRQLPTLTSLFHFRDFKVFGEEGERRGCDFWTSADFITAAIRELGRV